MKPWMIFPLVSASLLCAADGDRTIVQLHLNRNVPSFAGQTIDFGAARDSRVIAAPGAVGRGKVAGLTVSATPRDGKPGAYTVELSSGPNPAASAEVTSEAPVRLEIDRPAGRLPYRLGLVPNAGPNGSPGELMTWLPEYRAEGTLAVAGCHSLMAIWDLNADGVFDRRDFRGGSAVGIDLDGDGKIAGRGEFVFGGEVFEFCGRRFFVDPDSLRADGSSVTVVETSLEKPKLGSPVPTLIMETTDGATLRSAEWKGKVVLLDFWASWCGYCIEGFSTIKQIQEEFTPSLQVISVNTDEPSAMAAAREVVRSHDMPWHKVMSGKGLDDPLWMMFQGLDHSMPQYVVIDRQGIVRYSGSGGEKLVELRAAVEKYSEKPKP